MIRVVLAVLVLAALPGCAPRQAQVSQPLEGKPEPQSYESEEVTVPPVPYEEYRLPQSWHLGGYGNRYAVGSESWASGGAGNIVLLDMDAGGYATVLASPIHQADGFVVLTTRCSDQWIAWEELRGDEQNDPWNVEWKLYAAPIRAEGGEIGAAVLVAESVVSVRSRPMFDIVGDSVYWMTNSSPNPEQDGAVRLGRVDRMALLTGEAEEVYRGEQNIRTCVVQGGQLVLSLYVRQSDESQEVVVIDLESGRRQFSEPLGNGEQQIAHWPAYLDGTLSWAQIYSSNRPHPRLYLRARDGKRYVLSDAGSDPCFVGRYLVYESSPSASFGAVRWESIKALDLQTDQEFVLWPAEGESRTPTFNAPIAQPYRDSTYLIWGQAFGEEGDPKTGSWVRRYHL